MKAIPILVAVLAAATVNAAEAVEKRNNYPGITMKVSGRQRAPADGRAKASPPARAHGLIPFDPKVRVDGLADIVDGGSATYEMWVTNEGTDPLVGPLGVDFDNSPAFATAVVDGQGWTCLSFFGVFCEWPGTLQPGQSTGRARFTIAVAPPYGNAAECDPERSPCVFLRANLGAYDADSVYSAVTVNGEVPPTAVDDAVVMAAVPVPSHFNILRNDIASPSFTFALIEAPQHGTLAIDPVTYQVLYTPGPAYPGTDTFRYRLTEPNGASDTAVVTIGPLQGGISFDSALADIGNVEPGRIAMVLSWLENTTGQVLQGEHTVHAIDPADFPGILAGTPYDPADAVSDPSVFRQGGFFAGSDFEPLFSVVRPNPPIGRVWLARQRLTLSPVNSPDITLQAEIVAVARSGAVGDVPVFVRDDAFSVPEDQPSIVHPLANDASAGGHLLSPTALSIFNPFEDDGGWLEGNVNFIESAPPFGAEYTPPPGFVGPTSFWYADSEIMPGDRIRYDWAKVSLTVGTLPPPPTAVASGSATICAGASTGLTGSGGVSCSWVPATGLDDASSCTPMASPASTTTYTLTVRDATQSALDEQPDGDGHREPPAHRRRGRVGDDHRRPVHAPVRVRRRIVLVVTRHRPRQSRLVHADGEPHRHDDLRPRRHQRGGLRLGQPRHRDHHRRPGVAGRPGDRRARPLAGPSRPAHPGPLCDAEHRRRRRHCIDHAVLPLAQRHSRCVGRAVWDLRHAGSRGRPGARRPAERADPGQRERQLLRDRVGRRRPRRPRDERSEQHGGVALEDPHPVTDHNIL